MLRVGKSNCHTGLRRLNSDPSDRRYIGSVKWLGLFGQVSRFYKWMTTGFRPQPGLVGTGTNLGLQKGERWH